MKGYQELAEKIVFSFEEALKIFMNPSTTYSALRRLSNHGFIKKVRNNLYVSINPATKLPFANKYQIGSSINDDAYVSYLSALEYYGYINQVNQICYVTSKKRFNSFEFDGITYKHKQLKSTVGVTLPKYTEKIRISDKEKSVVDCIYDIDTSLSLEELYNSIALITDLNESKLLEYLEGYNIQSLYQKSGYILFLCNDTLNLSDYFFEAIKAKIKQSVTYLSEESKIDGVFIKTYQLVVPMWLVNKGADNAV